MFGPDVEAAAKAHARAEWPREAVGYVIGGVYVPQVNIAPHPTREFAVADDAWSDDVQAVVHSHAILGKMGVDERRAPSKSDMIAQMSAGVPFGILADDSRISTGILWFGDHVLDEPLIGRKFVCNVRDCYELVRAWTWQTRRIKIKSFPRDALWWERDSGQDLLMESFREVGCRQVGHGDARTGDGLLMAPFGGKVNHCAVLTGNGLMMHHRNGMLSVEEPWSDAWRRVTRMVVRYHG